MKCTNGTKRNFDFVMTGNALQALLSILARIEDQMLPKKEEIEKAVRTSIKELCTASLDFCS